eukprot:336301-Heterocapsa_arctica.AAC.1
MADGTRRGGSGRPASRGPISRCSRLRWRPGLVTHGRGGFRARFGWLLVGRGLLGGGLAQLVDPLVDLLQRDKRSRFDTAAADEL